MPEYWSPPSLVDLARRTGFDIESLIFTCGIGGIGAVATVLCRPNLGRKTWVGGLLFLVYCVIFPLGLEGREPG